MAECRDKNMIDKDEYPRTAELERRCVAHARRPVARPRPASRRSGCSTTGSSEACMLAGMALKRRWSAAEPRPLSGHRPAQSGHGHQRPGLLGEVLQLLGGRAAAGARWRATGSTSTPQAAAELCDENTIGVVGGPRLDLRRVVRAGRRDLRGARRPPGAHRARRPGPCGRRVRRDGRAVPRPGPDVGLPAAARRLHQHLGAQVRPGLPGRRLGAVARHGARCPRSWSSGSTTWAATCRPSR